MSTNKTGPGPGRARGWLRSIEIQHLILLAMATLGLVVLDELTGITRPFERHGYLLDRSVPKAVVAVVVSIFLASASLLLIRARSRALSLIVLVVMILGTAVELGFNIFTRRGFSEDVVAISMREIGMAPDALAAYGDGRVLAAILTAIAAWAFIYFIVRRDRWFGRLVPGSVATGVIVVLIVFSVGWRLRFDHFRLFPVQFRPAVNVIDYYAQQLALPEREAAPVRLVDRQLVSNRIVLLVDESIRPDYLSMNGYSRPSTPYLASISPSLINLGTAVSGSTCSQTSNVMLNSYVRPEDVGDRHAINSRPTIFYFAKRAGFHTVLMSAVYKTPTFYGIRKTDLEDVDETILINLLYDDPKYYNDHHLVEELGRLYERHGPTKRLFVYVRKQGTHFPFDDYYPEYERPFTPILGDQRPMKDHKSELLNSYLNGIRWNLDSFYRALHARVGDEHGIYIYTSDHGENVELENEELLHCGMDRSMAMVPLWIDVRGDDVRDRLEDVFGSDFKTRNRDRVSHVNVFPTLLKLMNVQTSDLTLFDDLSGQIRRYFPPGYQGTFRTLPFDEIDESAR